MSAPPPGARDTVILVHGLGRTRLSMWPLARRLARAGYSVVSWGYPSRRLSIAAIAARLRAELDRRLAECRGRVHLVTHSLGGIVARAALAGGASPDIGRVVMLGPPNRGSELVDRLRALAGFRLVAGVAGLELGTDPASTPNRLGPVAFECGVIVGARPIDPFLSRLIPGDNDGKVSVDRARVDGMRDFLVVPHGHTFIMWSAAVARQVVHFLERGKFARQ